MHFLTGVCAIIGGVFTGEFKGFMKYNIPWTINVFYADVTYRIDGK